jgi:hypothetical protein
MNILLYILSFFHYYIYYNLASNKLLTLKNFVFKLQEYYWGKNIII